MNGSHLTSDRQLFFKFFPPLSVHASTMTTLCVDCEIMKAMKMDSEMEITSKNRTQSVKRKIGYCRRRRKHLALLLN